MFSWFKKKEKNVKLVASSFLGPVGKMIAQSKTAYKLTNPKNLVVFNAVVMTDQHQELWCGDLDLTLEEDNLVCLAAELNCIVLVYPETRGKDKRVLFVYKTDGVDYELGQWYQDYNRIYAVIQYDRNENKTIIKP